MNIYKLYNKPEELDMRNIPYKNQHRGRIDYMKNGQFHRKMDQQ